MKDFLKRVAVSSAVILCEILLTKFFLKDEDK